MRKYAVLTRNPPDISIETNAKSNYNAITKALKNPKFSGFKRQHLKAIKLLPKSKW